MRTLGIIAASLAVIALALYGGSLWAFPSVTVRYRLTLVVDVDGRPHTGSGVVEVTRQDTTRVFGAIGGVGAIIKGEAIGVDLGERGTLFVIMHGRDLGVAEDRTFPSYILFYAFADQLEKGGRGLDQLRVLKARHPRTEISTSLIPMLVRFRDIANPATIEVVDASNLAASFGPNVALQRATIEITDDPVTTGIEKKLPWLNEMKGYLDGSLTHYKNIPSNALSAAVFKRGL